MIKLHFNRILFLTCPTGTYCREDRCQSFFDPKLIPTMRPPLEECEAAGAIRELGAQSLVIDAPAMNLPDDKVESRIEQFAPDLIILAVTFGSLNADLVWAARIKERFPSSTLGLRGAPCYVWAEKILEEHSSVDLCVRGDYELVFHHLLTEGKERSDGVVSRSSEGKIYVRPPLLAKDLTTLPFPDRSCIDSSLYRVRVFGMKQATVRVQRGCPFPCTYCLVHTVNGNRARHRSPDHIVQEVQELQTQGINHIYFRADTFSVDRSWALELAERLKRDCPGLHWVTTTRIECVDEVLLTAFRASGCYGLSFGIDVASKEIALKVKKPLSLERAEKAIRLCDAQGIISLAYIMIGFLWETEETLEETRSFIRSLRPDLLTIHFAHPYPGTPYYEAVQASKSSICSVRAQAEPALILSTLSPDDLKGFGVSLLRQHYLRPQVLYSLTRKLAAFGVRLCASQIRTKLVNNQKASPSAYI